MKVQIISFDSLDLVQAFTKIVGFSKIDKLILF